MSFEEICKFLWLKARMATKEINKQPNIQIFTQRKLCENSAENVAQMSTAPFNGIIYINIHRATKLLAYFIFYFYCHVPFLFD